MGQIRTMRALLREAWQGRLRDRPRLLRKLSKLEGSLRRERRVSRELSELGVELRESIAEVRKLKERRPEICYPEDLPIAAHRREIAEAVAANPVVVVSGETGSGKTTQLPKICLELGRGAAGMIGCTQPRRIAAVTVSGRVAQELGQEIGGLVGWQTRFGRKLSRGTQVKFMTDGILLAETRGDRDLLAYDTLIIDEAHERTLNIDFLVGYVRQLLKRRPELKVIISSATMDVARFGAFFNAPVIEVPGQLHPVELRYRPAESEDVEIPSMVARAVDNIDCEGGEGDILVFLSGERDIRETGEVLTGRRFENTEVLPLLASLPAQQQQRAFKTSSRRRIVLATNVAETSVTIPGIRYVIDSGVARISRYNHRTQVQRLHIEAVSQASANQRKGRCGRLGPGICYRLYEADDFEQRDAFTDPEIKRTSLASVILMMIDLNLGSIETFPFLEPPTPAIIREGYRELYELGALDDQRQLTRLGRLLARLPIEPRFGRMLFAAEEEGVVNDVLTIVASLTTDDPRLRPIDRRDEADRLHARFNTETSDFAGIVKLWRFLEEAQVDHRSQGRLRTFCRKNMLSYRRVREWRDVREQLARQAKELGLKRNNAVQKDEAIHRALLSGLLSRIGIRHEKGDYKGARGVRFAIFPGSGLFSKGPKWIMAGELVDTTRLYARRVGAINPDWVEPLAEHLCSYSYHSPYWDAETGFVRVIEKVSLFGLPLEDGRRRDFSRIEPALCRELFIRHALLAGDMPRKPKFLKHNLALVDEMQQVEHKTRHRHVLVDEDRLFAFYDRQLPAEICNARALGRYCGKPGTDLTPLHMRREDFSRVEHRMDGFPDNLTVDGEEFSLSYRHERGHPQDGITVTAPLSHADVLKGWRADWLVPGALTEKVTYMIYGLPKAVRKLISPLEETVRVCVEKITPYKGTLSDALRKVLESERGVSLPREVVTWRETALPVYLRMNYRVLDDEGDVLAEGRELEEVMASVGPIKAVEPSSGGTRAEWERRGITTWDFGDLPDSIEAGESGYGIYYYPALIDRVQSVDLEMCTTADEAAGLHRAGVRRLFALALGKEYRALSRKPSMPLDAATYYSMLGGKLDTLGSELAQAALNHQFLDGCKPLREQAEFEKRLSAGSGGMHNKVHELSRLVSGLLSGAAELSALIDTMPVEAMEDVHVQLAHLVFPGFVANVDADQLSHYPRYFEALRRRIEKARHNPAGDAQKAARIAPHWGRYCALIAVRPRPACDRAALAEYRWMVEEFRVSLFAQELRTACKVSDKRLDTLWARVL